MGDMEAEMKCEETNKSERKPEGSVSDHIIHGKCFRPVISETILRSQQTSVRTQLHEAYFQGHAIQNRSK